MEMTTCDQEMTKNDQLPNCNRFTNQKIIIVKVDNRCNSRNADSWNLIRKWNRWLPVLIALSLEKFISQNQRADSSSFNQQNWN